MLLTSEKARTFLHVIACAEQGCPSDKTSLAHGGEGGWIRPRNQVWTWFRHILLLGPDPPTWIKLDLRSDIACTGTN